MILTFSQILNNKQTYFIEKIWSCLYYNRINFEEEFNEYNSEFKIKFQGAIFLNRGVTAPKRHTIRKDSANRWKADNDIHFTINPRTKNQFQFAPVIKCVSVQNIWIQSHTKIILVENYLNDDKTITDNCFWKELQKDEIINLIKNDGFENTDDFWNYFNQTDFYGKIIHWTNLKY